MKLIEKLKRIWENADNPFLIYRGTELKFSQIVSQHPVDFSAIKAGDVVALIGDFNPISIIILLQLIDLNAIVVPLTLETSHEHEYFFESAYVDVIICNGVVTCRKNDQKNELIEKLRAVNHAGLVLFTSGTTGRPKAIIHDLTFFLRRFETPRPTFRTINFLLFDHIGGINTLLHTLFNKGVVIAPESRNVDSILDTCRKFDVEVLPTTPTFLRMLLMSGAVPDKVPESIKVITYGTECMDLSTLSQLCNLLPSVDFRQTFGMSELGIVRVKSETRDSLFMSIGGEGIETRVVENILHIRSEFRMLGYINAPSPFDSDGWLSTKDIVEQKNGLFKIVGRISDVINVGGLKFMASEVERVALTFPNITFAKAYPKNNPITGQHVELLVQPSLNSLALKETLMSFLKEKLQPHMVPKRIKIEDIAISHRFKRN